MASSRLYLYLARLDKTGIKVVAALPHESKVYPTRIRDPRPLGLSPDLNRLVSSESHHNRMTHELYAESASSFEDLKRSLRSRGYTNLPIQQFSGYVAPSRVNENALITSESSMIKRSSEVR